MSSPESIDVPRLTSRPAEVQLLQITCCLQITWANQPRPSARAFSGCRTPEAMTQILDGTKVGKMLVHVSDPVPD
jgi:hypothetical protein